MKKLMLMISAVALCVPCFGQEAPVYPCSPAEETVFENAAAPCAPAEEISTDCDQNVFSEQVVVARQVSRRPFLEIGTRECAIKRIAQNIRVKRTSKRTRHGIAQPCAPAQVAAPYSPVSCD